MESLALLRSTRMAIGKKKLVAAAIPVVIEVAAGTGITESTERIDLPEAVAGAVSIQESVTTMTVDAIVNTMMRIAADHVVTADAERSIRSVVTEAAVKAAVTTTTTIPRRIDAAGPEAEMKGAIENLLDNVITKELYSHQRFLS